MRGADWSGGAEFGAAGPETAVASFVVCELLRYRCGLGLSRDVSRALGASRGWLWGGRWRRGLGDVEVVGEDVREHLSGLHEERAAGMGSGAIRGRGCPLALLVRAPCKIDRGVADSNPLDDEFLYRPSLNLRRGLVGEGGADVLNELRGWKERTTHLVDRLGEAGLIGLPQRDLGYRLVLVFFEEAAEPFRGALWFV